ncbi:MAG: hypothetical protein IKJ14_03215 [Clostridia bacterium]|nr:hypothetical protein [Clostridia bacterium]
MQSGIRQVASDMLASERYGYTLFVIKGRQPPAFFNKNLSIANKQVFFVRRQNIYCFFRKTLVFFADIIYYI